MSTNLMQLRRLVRSRLGIPLDDDFMPDNVLDDHINLALQTIDAEAHWPWADALTSVAITPGDPGFTVEKDWRATRAVFYEDRELMFVAPADLLRWNDVNADVPSVWTVVGDRIDIRAIPNGDMPLTHLWYRQAAWLYKDAEAPSLPGEYTGAVVAKAAELLAQRESSGGDANRHAGEYVEWISRMRKDMRRSTPGARARVRPGSWV